MMQIIKGVLSPEILAEFQKVLANSEFVDGAATAGKAAEKVKNNLELAPNSPNRELLNNAAMGAIMSCAEFQYGAMPARISTPIFAKYHPGMTYGYHVDDPIMGAGGDTQYRSDVSLTLFLNNSSEYEGGELSIRTSFGIQEVKLDAGDMVVYPSSSLHQVNPVTKGERLVMITWMQSMVRDPSRREVLFNLWQARNILLDNPDNAASDLVDVSYVNLVRMWSNP
jgi:PKHD-type hydroxylase